MNKETEATIAASQTIMEIKKIIEGEDAYIMNNPQMNDVLDNATEKIAAIEDLIEKYKIICRMSSH